MVNHTINTALSIFRYAFPGCVGLWAFDNATNHNSYAKDALNAKRMNLSTGGGQPIMREGFDHERGLPQAMVFPDNHQTPALRGKPKGLEIVLRERGLWPRNGRRADGFKFRLQCPSGDRGGCDNIKDNTGLKGRCCARTLMATQRDFKEQKGRLHEELEAAGQEVIFYPKFHCELNFIERFWCSCKAYTRQNCTYSIQGLRELVPKAITASTSTATINRYYYQCMRTLDAYATGHVYGSLDFKNYVKYKGHRQVVDKSKW